MRTSTTLAQGPVSLVLALAGALALALGLLAAVPAGAQDQAEDDEVTPARVAGENRVETAANIATLTFDQADVAHLVFAGDFPDALAASYGAGVVDGPVLMPAASDDLGAITANALEALGVQEVRLVGGAATLTPALEQQLVDRGYETQRIAGHDRYATSAEVAKAYGLAPGDTVRPVHEPTAVMASGADFPDALAAGPLVAAQQMPLVLTPPHRSDAAVEEALDLLDVERIFVVGGDAAVSPQVEQHYRNLGYSVERVAGSDRGGTAATLADLAMQRFDLLPATALLARGDAFPDALAAGIHGAVVGAPILLTHSPDTLYGQTADWFARTCPHVDVVRALGGQAAVSASALDDAVTAAQACHDGTQPVGDPGLHDREGDGDFADLVDVRTAAHDGFDRIVLEYTGAAAPSWAVSWTDQPRYQPADQPADVAGTAFLEISLSAGDEWGEEETYLGPDRVGVADGNVALEVYKTSDFEGWTTWTAGLERQAPFAVDVQDNRLIVDVVDQ